ncbi:acyltransferase [Dickeya undicola]|uniref:Acyltransferase n=1 Tax=Dickeya undicola TaxID=1577887 RepID=A0ABX9WZ85_9GAMM|nr:acyltransferase [Dickeya undicola]RNM26512.1 acyltransferase [Dickeya undicola]
MSRIADIDRLRAVAVLGTIYSHIPDLWLWKIDSLEFMRKFTGGYAGVILFFVISGFVISKSLLPKFNAAQSNEDKNSVIKSFFIKRLFRITPSALIWIFISYVIFYYTDRSLAIGNLYGAIASAFNFFNIYAFSQPSTPNMFGIYWSLSLEEQFYLILPLILFLVRKEKYRVGLFISIIILNIAITSVISNPFPFATIISGVLLFYLMNKLNKEKLNSFRGADVTYKTLAIVGIILMFSLPNIKLDFNINNGLYLAIVSVLFFMLVLIAAQDKGYILDFRVTNPIVSWVGTRSFTIYLAHYPIMLLVRGILMSQKSVMGIKYNSDYNVQIFCLFIFITVIVAEVSYRLIEVFFINIGINFIKKKNLTNRLERTLAE